MSLMHLSIYSDTCRSPAVITLECRFQNNMTWCKREREYLLLTPRSAICKENPIYFSFPKLHWYLQRDGDHQSIKCYKLQVMESRNLYCLLTCSTMSRPFRVMLIVWGCPFAMFLWSTSMLYGSLVPPRLYRICRFPSERNVKSILRYFHLYSPAIFPSLFSHTTVTILHLNCSQSWSLQ